MPKNKPEDKMPAREEAKSDSENAARRLYDGWKKRVEESGHVGDPEMYARQPFPPYPPYPPPYPPPGMMSPGAMPRPPFQMAGGRGSSRGSTESLFGSLGSLIRLGVEAMNMGLAGGVEIVRGFSGAMQGEWEPYRHGGHHQYGADDCCEYWECDCGGCDCCGDRGDCGCNPGVHGCH